MTGNKATVERYIDGFNRTDHEQILSCLTEDVEWEMLTWGYAFGSTAGFNVRCRFGDKITLSQRTIGL